MKGLSPGATFRRLVQIAFGVSFYALSGCTSEQFRVPLSPSGARGDLSAGSGIVMGSREPIGGATIQIYAVGTTGNGSASTPLLANPLVSDSTGKFSWNSLPCPSPTTPVYLTATGGNSESANGINNQLMKAMVALGPCENVLTQNYVTINEVTTVAAAFALSPFMRSYKAVGSGPESAAMMEDAFTLAAQLANPATGTTPGVHVPVGQTIPTSKLVTLANILSSCVDAPDVKTTDYSSCRRMFLLTSQDDSAPSDTAGAMRNLALLPTNNVVPIFELQSSLLPYHPALSSPPVDWSLDPYSPTTAPTFLPAPGTYSDRTLVILSDATPSSAIYYTMDGSRPSTSSSLYTGAIAVSSTSMIRAVAVAAGVSSLLAVGSYAIEPSRVQKLAFITQPSSGAAGAPLTSSPVVAIEGLNGILNKGAKVRVTLHLASNPGGATLSGTTTVTAVSGLATFPGLSVSAPGTGYSLIASADGILPVTSARFNLTNAVSLMLPLPSVVIGSQCTATFSLAAPAPQGGLVASISSSDPAILAVSAASVTIPAGQTQGLFTYNGIAPGNATVSVRVPPASAASATVTVTAATVPNTYFGMTVQYYESTQPLLSYGTTRSWDAYYWYFNNTPGLDWPHISATRGNYNFAALDDFIRINQARQQQIIYTFGRTPRWASSQPNNNASPYGMGECAPPSNMADWDAFVTAIATHAKGTIKYWELWNEPQNSYGYCGDIPTMVTMAQHAYKILKSIDPTNTVLTPAVTSNDGPAWLTSYLAAGGTQYADVLAFHGYWSTTAEDIKTVVSSYRTIAIKYGLGGLPMWDTESSWAGRNGAVGGLTDPSQRAAYLAKSYLLHWSLNVPRFLWYAYDSEPQWGELWDSVNGLHQDGVAYQQVHRWMVGASLPSPCFEDVHGNWSCNLTRTGGYNAIAVWNSNSTPVYSVPNGYTQYLDLAGNVHPITGHQVTLGNLPILLETGTMP